MDRDPVPQDVIVSVRACIRSEGSYRQNHSSLKERVPHISLPAQPFSSELWGF